MSNGITVSPIDIQQKRFHVVFRGYERSEVETFLDMVRDNMEQLMREVTDLREFRQGHDQRVRELGKKEEMINSTMLMTQKLMEDQKDNARREAAVIIKEAELSAQQILRNAQEEKAKLDVDIQELKRRKHHFLQDVMRVVQMHQEMVNFEAAGGEKIEELGRA